MRLDETASTVLNLDRLSASAGGDQRFMAELAALYVTDTNRKLPALEAAVAAGEARPSGEIAHGIKGASAAVGAEEAAQAFRTLERLGRAGKAVGLAEALEAARDAFERAREQLERVAA